MKVFFAILLTLIGVFFGVTAANTYSSGDAAIQGAIAAACLLGVYLLIRRPASKASDAQGR